MCALLLRGQAADMALKILPDGRMDPKNAAAYLGLAMQTLANKRSDGTGPKFVKRGRIFYYRADLDAWLRAGRARSTADVRPLKATDGSGER